MKITLFSSEPLHFSEEDDGCAHITVCDGPVTTDVDVPAPASDDLGLFVKIQSWSEYLLGDPDDYGHALTALLQGKRVKVTIETVD